MVQSLFILLNALQDKQVSPNHVVADILGGVLVVRNQRYILLVSTAQYNGCQSEHIRAKCNG